MNLFVNQPRWKKYGVTSALLYLSLMGLLVVGSISGMMGKGENDLFGWIMLCLMLPVAWLSKLLGINLVVSTSILLISLINVIILFSAGSLMGYLLDRIKKKA